MKCGRRATEHMVHNHDVAGKTHKQAPFVKYVEAHAMHGEGKIIAHGPKKSISQLVNYIR